MKRFLEALLITGFIALVACLFGGFMGGVYWVSMRSGMDAESAIFMPYVVFILALIFIAAFSTTQKEPEKAQKSSSTSDADSHSEVQEKP